MGEVMTMMNYSLRVLLILRTPVMIIMTEVVGYYLLRKEMFLAAVMSALSASVD